MQRSTLELPHRRRLAAPLRFALLLAATAPLLFAGLQLVGGCSDDGGGNGGPRPASDGGLFACDEPGKPCNAHDVCAIDPVCGEDGYCRAKATQDCDDGLDCTIDECLGAGRCDHKVAEAYCTLLDPKTKKLACMIRGAVNPRDPCEICDSKTNQTGWTGRNGGLCDDEEPCTVGDQCIDGVCTGKSHSCSDNLQCTEDVCDGKGGCSNPMKANWCLIDGRCHRDQETDGSGCRKCDPATEINAWVTVDNTCKIGGRCIADGAFDATGCGVCDHAADPTGWTTAPGTCLVDGVCLKAGDKPSSSCGICDPAQSTSALSPPADGCMIAGACKAAGDLDASGCGTCNPAQSKLAYSPVAGAAQASAEGFESGPGGFVFSAAVGGVGWQVSSARAHGGGASLYYGNPQKATIDAGGVAQGSAEGPELSLAAGTKAALHFWLWLAVEAVAEHDQLTVSAGGKTLWTKTPATVPPSLHGHWLFVSVDLSSLAGQTVKLRFDFDTVDDWANQGEGVYIDDLAVVTCP